MSNRSNEIELNDLYEDNDFEDGIFEDEDESYDGWSLWKFLSVLFFRQIFPQMLRARKGNLRVKDLHRIPRTLRYEKYENSLKPRWEEQARKKRPKLIWILIRQEWFSLLISFIGFAVYELFSLGFPITTLYISRWLGEKDPDVGSGVLFVVLIYIFQIFICFSQEFAKKWSFVSALRIRNGLIGLIYDKALKLNAAGIEEPGRLVNLMANDAAIFIEHLEYFLCGISCPPMFIVLYAYVFYYMRLWVFVALGVLVIFLVINFFFAILTSILYKKFVYKRDLRVSYLNEVLRNIKFIKYNVWEGPVKKKIDWRRLIEEIFLYTCEFIRCFFYTLTNQFGSVLAVTLFIIMVLAKVEMDMPSITTTISLFKSIRVPVRRIGMAATSYSAMNVSMKRIKRFLLRPELQPIPVETNYSKNAIELKDVEYRFPNGDIAFSCDELAIQKGELVCVLGSVGGGKSSFILSLLNELERVEGNVMLNGQITYSPQSALLLNATVRSNICFLAPYNREKYVKAIKDSCFTADIERLIGGDQYIIAEKGANLSGGQRQRIALARSLYNARDIVLLDDPLSHVDFKVGSYIFKHAICENLEGKTRIIVTNQTYFLENADRILVIENNKLAFNGTLEELKESNLEAASFVKTLSEKKDDHHEDSSEVVSGDAYSTKSPEEAKEVGRVPVRVYWSYIKSAYVIFGVFVVLFLAGRITAQYFYNIYLTSWKKSLGSNPIGGDKREFTKFCIAFGVDFVALLITEIAVILFCIIASHNLHKTLIGKLLRSKLAFFDITPMGRILNYFSKDFQQIDYVIPANIERLIINIASVVTIFITVIKTSYYLLILVVVIVAVFVGFYYFVSKPIIEMQRIEGVLRSPIFVHFDQSLLGLSTIRVEKGQVAFKEDLVGRVKENTMASYTTMMTKLWYLQRMDFIGTVVIIITNIVIVVLKLRDVLDKDMASTALNNLTNVTTNVNVIGLSLIEIETAMQSTERVLQINKLRNEESRSVKKHYEKPPKDWPSQGVIEFNDFSFRYRKGLPLVLKNVSAKIYDKEKIGVVGRTGSGKSTFMAGLFRIEEPANGQIFVDGYDITKVPLKILRKRMCILPQEATMFSGTVRDNLDPFGNSNDEEMSEILRLVNSPYDLDNIVLENGDNFSLGQKQLFCIARALVKKSKILIMDEATANIDIQTDQTIQEMVRKNFSDCTVITVAHRLQTIMDSDRVMVFDSGELIENDIPYELIDKEDTIFNSLVQQSGCAEDLKRVAYKKKKLISKESDSALEDDIYYF